MAYAQKRYVSPGSERKELKRLAAHVNTTTSGVAVANIATADATDAATTQTLANVNKAKINALLTALRTAGIIAT